MNVSMPNKTTIVKYLDHLTPVAKMAKQLILLLMMMVF